jgi:hypothetical protein
MEINIGTWNMHYWQERFGNNAKSVDEKKQWGIKCRDILEDIMQSTDFILLQETNPFIFPELISGINIYYHQHPIETFTRQYILNNPQKIRDNIWTPDHPNGFLNVLPFDSVPPKESDGFIRILHNVCVPGIANDYINILSDDDSWGSAIIANKKYELLNMYFFRSLYIGSPLLMCYEFRLSDKKTIIIMNLYGKNEHTNIKNDYGNYIYYSDSTIHRMLSDITPIIYKAEINNILVLGGDLNADINAKGGTTDKPIFECIENLGFSNLTQNIKTYYPNNGNQLQDDYIFIKYFIPQTSCPEINYDPKIQEISPHAFIKVNLKIDL